MAERTRNLIGLVVAGVVLVILIPVGFRLYIDYIWYDELAFTSVFVTIWTARFTYGIIGGLLFAAFIYLNYRVARGSFREFPKGLENVIPYPYEQYLNPKWIDGIMTVISLFLGLLAGLIIGNQWAFFERFRHRVMFEIPDPLYGIDLGFYLFQLPLYRLIYFTIGFGLFFAAVIALVLYFLNGSIVLHERRISIHPKAKNHLLGLAAGYFLLKTVGYRISQYDLLYSERGAVFGASYTDVHALLPGLWVLLLLAFVLAALAVGNIFFQGMRYLYGGVVLLVLVSFITGTVYPTIVQSYIVSPNEIERETPFAEHNIRFTRLGFGLDRIEEIPFQPVVGGLDLAAIQRNRGTIDNIRLWDPDPLTETYFQMQSLRPYYRFPEVNLDRYTIENRYRQVLIAARELDSEEIPARTWLNEHLKFTHGYGVVMSPTADISGQGLPTFFLRDMPPRATVAEPNLAVRQPEIYYGRLTHSYALVNTDESEFNHPLGSDARWTHYDGHGGIPVGSFLNRVAASIYHLDPRIFLTDAVHADSRLQMHRHVEDRVRRVAPFLLFDEDPYIVLADGRLYWIVDAYTTSNAMPYAERLLPRELGERVPRINYVRNSVKAVVDAYNGDVTLYVMEDEPIINTWQNVFPDVFVPYAEMPEGLVRHIRWPQDIFNWQTRLYVKYHMTDPETFLTEEDLFRVPREEYRGEREFIVPYYLIMQLPGEPEPEYIQIMPYTPAERDNLVAWLTARSDEPNYGDLKLFNFPRDEFLLGPPQVEARIDQDDRISEAVTLWGQAGSTVIRGNLLVIPIEDSLLYVEPLYLEADEDALPELRRVIVAFEEHVAFERTLDEALAAIFGAAVLPPDLPGLPGVPDIGAPTGEVAQLIEEAQRLWDEMRDAQRQDDWATYGERLRELGDVLQRLQQAAQEPAADDDAQAAVPEDDAVGS